MLNRQMFDDLAILVNENKSCVDCEENTKNYLINPFLSVLGFNPSSPKDIKCEYTCDYKDKNGKKVDYAVFDDGELVFLVEAKDYRSTDWFSNSRNLKNIQEYFIYSQARLLIFTNGVEYRFFTDSLKDNIMDDEPFKIIDILNLSDEDIAFLNLLEKGNVNIGKIRSDVFSVGLGDKLLKWFKDQALCPSDSFVRLVKTDVSKYVNEDMIRKYIQNILVNGVGSPVEENTEKNMVATKESGIFSISLGQLNVNDLVGTKAVALRYKNTKIPIKYYTGLYDALISVLSKNGVVIPEDKLCECGIIRKEAGYKWIKPVHLKDYTNLYYNAHGSTKAHLQKFKTLVNSIDIELCDDLLIDYSKR